MAFSQPNPFSTRFVRPGKSRFIFETDGEESQLVARCLRCDWFGQIVGPHGSGKTTLTYALQQHFQHDFSTIERLTVADGGQVRNRTYQTLDTASLERPIFVIDGFERIAILHRIMLVRHCRINRIGLLLTTHRTWPGLPVLFRTSLGRDRLQRVIAQFCPETEWGSGPSSDPMAILDELIERHGENGREILMEMYDLWPRHRQAIA